MAAKKPVPLPKKPTPTRETASFKKRGTASATKRPIPKSNSQRSGMANTREYGKKRKTMDVSLSAQPVKKSRGMASSASKTSASEMKRKEAMAGRGDRFLGRTGSNVPSSRVSPSARQEGAVKKRGKSKRPTMGAGVPGFTYGRDTI